MASSQLTSEQMSEKNRGKKPEEEGWVTYPILSPYSETKEVVLAPIWGRSHSKSKDKGKQPMRKDGKIGFLDLDGEIQKKIFQYLLPTGQELTPFEYSNGGSKVNINKEKPKLEVLLAFCKFGDSKIAMSADVARNVLYRENRFRFTRLPSFIRFIATIGPINIHRLSFQHNLSFTQDLLRVNPKTNSAMQWFCSWKVKMHDHMLGCDVFRHDISSLPEQYLQKKISPLRLVATAQEQYEMLVKQENITRQAERRERREPKPRVQSLYFGESFEEMMKNAIR